MLHKRSFRIVHHIAIVMSIVALFTVFAALPANAQYDYTVLHTFTGPPDGAFPSPLIQDSEGNLYGTTWEGGLGTCCGVVFKVDAAGNETVLYEFPGGNTGGYPVAGLVQDASGNLYGTTQGDSNFGLSVLFKLTPEGQETSWIAPSSVNWGSLNSPVTLDAQGNLYGMVPYGGTPNCGWEYNGLGCGTLFKMTPSGEFSTIHTFTGTDGMYPQSGLVQDSKGNFYGAAVFGGISTCRAVGNGKDNDPGCGTIFKVDSTGNFSVLYTFTNKKDGSGPLGLIIDSEDNLYGIATGGGNHDGNSYGYGTIFKLDTNTGSFKVLFTRTPNLSYPGAYYAPLLARDSEGNLYGGQILGCAHGAGCLFKVDTKGKYTDLFDFQAYTGYPPENQDGFWIEGILLGSAGDFYGSMNLAGSATYGTVFHITPTQ